MNFHDIFSFDHAVQKENDMAHGVAIFKANEIIIKKKVKRICHETPIITSAHTHNDSIVEMNCRK